MLQDKIGHEFSGVRKDGRIFVGIIENVYTWTDNPAKGELVIIKQYNGSIKSVYVNNLDSWTTTKPEGLTV